MGQYGTLDSNPLPFTSITTTVGPAAGSVLNNGAPRTNHSIIVIPTGTVTGGSVAIQVSNDNTNWVTPTGGTLTAGAATVGSSFVFVAQYVRANITGAITGGGSITAILASSVT